MLLSCATLTSIVGAWYACDDGNDNTLMDAQQTTIEPAAVTGDALNRYLYGADTTERIVAVERGGPDRVRVYRRMDGHVTEERASFRPWLLMTHEPAWADLAKDVRSARLAGDADYCWFVECRNWSVYQDVRNRLRDAGEEALVFNSPIQQYLISSGRTLFKGMVYEDLLRLQLDIEATSLDPFAPNARVFLVSVRTSSGEERLFGASGEDEATILDDVTAFIRDMDPDIIEGHNIFNYDMPYLLARAAACGTTLAWGRDGSVLRVGTNARAQFKVGARSIPYQQHFIYGRHIIDTYQQIQRYDVAGNLLQLWPEKYHRGARLYARRSRVHPRRGDRSRVGGRPDARHPLRARRCARCLRPQRTERADRVLSIADRP